MLKDKISEALHFEERQLPTHRRTVNLGQVVLTTLLSIGAIWLPRLFRPPPNEIIRPSPSESVVAVSPEGDLLRIASESTTEVRFVLG